MGFRNKLVSILTSTQLQLQLGQVLQLQLGDSARNRFRKLTGAGNRVWKLAENQFQKLASTWMG
jgi:hypothetical protein